MAKTGKRLVNITLLAALCNAKLSTAFNTGSLSLFHRQTQQHPANALLYPTSTTISNRNRNNGQLHMSSEGADPIEQTTIARLERGLTELNRRERRDFFDERKWVEHRASDRFVGNLISIPFSRVVWMIFKEVGIISAISWLLVAYNHGLVLGYTDINGVTYPPLLADLALPLLTLPKEPFILSSPALSLLLGTLLTLSLLLY
jgi:hypothetical protein